MGRAGRDRFYAQCSVGLSLYWTVTNIKVCTACVDVPANFKKDREPTSRLEPLTCSSYECTVSLVAGRCTLLRFCINKRSLGPSIAWHCRIVRTD